MGQDLSVFRFFDGGIRAPRTYIKGIAMTKPVDSATVMRVMAK